MKSIQSLSSMVLVGILNAVPCLAFSQPPSQSSSSQATAIDLNYRNNSTNVETNVKGKVLISDILRTIQQQQKRQDQLDRQNQQRQDQLDRQKKAAEIQEQKRLDRLEREEKAAAVREQTRKDRIDRQNQKRQDQLDREANAAAERKEIREAMQKRQEQMDLARKEASERDRKEADRRLQYYQSLSPAKQRQYIAEQNAIQKQEKQVAANLFGAAIQWFLTPNPRICQRGSWVTGYTYYECD